MTTTNRIRRHLRLSRRALAKRNVGTPPFLILFINSICNQACDHCFYWQNLNQRDDLTKDELFRLAESLGPIENLSLSGGEPFLRPELGEICRKFVDETGVKRIYTPTNGSFTEKTITQLREAFKHPGLENFTVELSLDGLEEAHNAMRKDPQGFAKSMRTYDALAEYQKEEPRLDIHSISTCTGENVDEIAQLSQFLVDRCPAMAHHNIAMIRGERKKATLQGPKLEEYRRLVQETKRIWRVRGQGRFGGIVDPMLHWGKIRAAETQTQAIPCTAGKLIGVVHANGDVALCEEREPIGNLRSNTFPEIWSSVAGQQQRCAIKNKECHCTSEVFMWPSIVFQPKSLVRGMIGGKVWKRGDSGS